MLSSWYHREWMMYRKMHTAKLIVIVTITSNKLIHPYSVYLLRRKTQCSSSHAACIYIYILDLEHWKNDIIIVVVCNPLTKMVVMMITLDRIWWVLAYSHVSNINRTTVNAKYLFLRMFPFFMVIIITTIKPSSFLQYLLQQNSTEKKKVIKFVSWFFLLLPVVLARVCMKCTYLYHKNCMYVVLNFARLTER